MVGNHRMGEGDLPKILIVDDHTDGQRLMEEMLRTLPAEIHKVSSGTEALGVIVCHEVAVVLMEVQVFGLDGLSTAIAMQSNKSMRQPPIIFITEAGGDDATEFKGYEAGAVDFLYKPVHPSVLRAKVEVFLNLYRLRREISNQNAILEERVAQRTAELKTACEVAEAASNAKGEFLANMSHELRTPMTAILGFTDILLSSLTQPENIDSARTVKENGEYLLNLINDILDLSKIESGNIDIEQIETSPYQIIADVVSLMNVKAVAKGLSLDVEFDSPVPETIRTDPVRIRQILINIVGNAIKFTETGSIRLIARLVDEFADEPKLQFDVVDTGIGIPEDKIDKIFKPFIQADGSTTRLFGGTGLGLSISKRLVELLGGKFSVSSTVNKGSTFTISVSTGLLEDARLIRNSAEAKLRVTDNEPSEIDGLSLCNHRILVVEDGADNQRFISFMLERAGAEVTLADNGRIGADLATVASSEGRPFDVMLMDMQMPVMDGYVATRQLRDKGYTLPIIALTAHAMAADRSKCIIAGCDDYMSKPISRKRLLELVAKYAARTNTPEAAIVES